MAENLLFDKLVYIDHLTRAGIDEAQARAHAEAMEEALRESVATKSDIVELRHEIQLAIRDLKIWTGSIAVLLFGALVAVRFFVH
ncbi:MAG: hypothetical protein JO189_06635 [Deltaproteobacteria bacterium]|nr:hypothetical protein [Deltaproteobacteria bacterium]